MRIPLKVFPTPDGAYGYSARISVRIALPSRSNAQTKQFEAIVDSGATRCLFNANLGRSIGLNIESGRLERTLGISAISNTYLHEIALYVPTGPIRITAGFMDGLPVPGLLGMNGFFENFIVRFDLSESAFDIERIHRI